MSLYLSRVVLDPRRREVQRALADCQAMHRAVMTAFPDVSAERARAALGVLYRLELDPRGAGPTLLVQSDRAPDWLGPRLAPLLLAAAGPPAVKPLDQLYATLRPGLRLRFRLRANPTRRLRLPPTPDGARPLGKRVDLRGDEAQLAWLARKGADHGFALVTFRVMPDAAVINSRAQPEGRWFGTPSAKAGEGTTGDRRRMTFRSVLFEGVLEVRDADALRAALAGGIGSGKAYGFGLLSVAPLGEA